MSLYTVHCVIILDSEGKRILSKYYNESKFPTLKDQLAFEQLLWAKTKRASEIALLENYIVLFRDMADTKVYFIGSSSENELLLYSALTGFTDAISHLLRQYVDKRTMLENLDFILLALDEIVDGGIIMEVDPDIVSSRVNMSETEGENGVPITEQSLGQALSTARQQIARTLLSNN